MRPAGNASEIALPVQRKKSRFRVGYGFPLRSRNRVSLPSNCGCTRRQAIRSLMGSSLLLPGVLSELFAADAARASSADPLAARPSHFPARAKRVIFLYMSGGVSHIDSFDPKPRLTADRGKKAPFGFYKAPDWEFSAHGRCGTEVSDLFPEIGGCVDDIAL